MLQKRFFLIAVAFVLTAGLLFAGGQREEADDDVITLEVMHYLDLADDTSTANFREVREAFAEAHPNIKLEFNYLFDEAYHNRLQASAVAGQLPDVVFRWPGKRTGDVTGAGLVKDLRPWVNEVEHEFAPAAVADQGPNGEMWELPEQITATHVMFTNDRLLDELGLTFPETFEELLEQGDAIRDAGYIPIAMDNAGGWQMQSTLLSALVERTGGREWFDRAILGDASFTDPEFVEALEIIQILSEEDMLTPGVNQAEYGQALTDFVNERAVYFVDGGWRTSNLASELTADQQQYVSYNVFPRLPNERGQALSTAIVAGTGFGMNANLEGAKADAAWEWIYFFSGPEGSRIKAAQGWLPATIDAIDDDAPLMTQKLANFLAVTPGGYVVDAVMDAEGMGVLHPDIQEMMFGVLTPAQVGENFERWVAANDSGRRR